MKEISQVIFFDRNAKISNWLGRFVNYQRVYEYESVRGAEYDVNGRHPVASELTLTPKKYTLLHWVHEFYESSTFNPHFSTSLSPLYRSCIESLKPSLFPDYTSPNHSRFFFARCTFTSFRISFEWNRKLFRGVNEGNWTIRNIYEFSVVPQSRGSLEGVYLDDSGENFLVKISGWERETRARTPSHSRIKIATARYVRPRILYIFESPVQNSNSGSALESFERLLIDCDNARPIFIFVHGWKAYACIVYAINEREHRKHLNRNGSMWVLSSCSRTLSFFYRRRSSSFFVP